MRQGPNLHLAPAFHGLEQGHFIHVFQVASYRDAMRNPRDAHALRLEQPRDARVREAGEEDRRQDARGHADDDRPGGDVEAADYHGEYPIHIASRFPGGSQQEVGQSDLRHGGNPVGKEEEADERHGQDGNRGSGGKEPPRHALLEGLP